MFFSTNTQFIKTEKAKAKELKKTKWWENKIKKGQCYHCENFYQKDDLSMDHLVPLSKGGKSHKKNLVVACKKCNFEKKNKDLVALRLKK